MTLGWSVVAVVSIIVLPFVAAWLTLAELSTQPDADEQA